MELRWRQTAGAWIAIAPDYEDDRGSKVEKPIHSFIGDLCNHLLNLVAR